MTPNPDQGVAASSAVRRRWVVGVGALSVGVWWLGSVLLHAGLFGLLYLANPKGPGQDAAAADDFHMAISPAHAEAVVADIREQQKAEFSKKVAALASIKKQLDALDATKVAQYDALMQAEVKQAPQLTRETAARARAGQEAALRAQTVAQDAFARLHEARVKAVAAQSDDEKAAAKNEYSDALQAAENAQGEARQSQKIVAAAQTTLAQEINLFGDGMTDATRAVQQAADAQQDADKQEQATADRRVDLPHFQRQAEEMAEEVQRRHAAVDREKQRVSAVEKQLADLQPPPPASSPQESPAAAGNVAMTDPEAVPSPTATPSSTPAPTPSKKVREETERLTKNLAQATGAEAKSAAQLAESEQKLAGRQADVVAAHAKLPADESAAKDKQQAALEALEKAEQQITQAMAKPDLATWSTVPSASPPTATPDDANLSQLFDEARQMETAVAESYKNVRAAELAAIRRIPLSQALSLTEVAKPVRPEIDTSILTRNIIDVEGIREQEKTIEATSAQMDSMVSLAQRMKDLAQPEQSAAISVETMLATAARSERMEQLAAQDEGTQAKDLTDAMADFDTPDDADDARQAAEIERAETDLEMAAARLGVAPLDPEAVLAYRDALAGLEALDAPGALAFADGKGLGTATRRMRSRFRGRSPYMNTHRFKPIPGRTVGRSMLAGPPDRDPTWMFVDSWYLIGPWPNPGRKNLNTKFPPESVVDLDATYTGARRDEVSLPVRWQFYQDPVVYGKKGGEETSGEIVPPGLSEYEIYYGYTELWFDEAADLWVAIGSDDQSKIWLNDQMIWKSSDVLKSWSQDEGLRRVHFKRGINRVLYRLENGRLEGGFSFIVCLNPNAPPTPSVIAPVRSP